MSDAIMIRSSLLEQELVEKALGKFETYGHSAGGMITPQEAAAMAARIHRLQEELMAALDRAVEAARSVA